VSAEKVMFALNIEDEWPPVGAEGVWCERINGNYKLINIPFFIPDLAFGDIFSAKSDDVNHQVFQFEVIEESGHSVVWVMNNENISMDLFIDMIKKLGCKLEEFPKFSIFAIDIPPEVNVIELDTLIGIYEKLGVAFAFPAWRHGD
jgi:hypothetical protein